MPGKLLTLFRFQHLWEVAKHDSRAAEYADSRIKVVARAKCATERVGSNSIRTNHAHRIESFHKQEQRLRVKGHIASFRFRISRK